MATKLGCCLTTVKFILFFFNFLIWLGGILFIVVSSLFLANVRIASFQDFIAPYDPVLRAGSWTLLGVGIFMLLVGFCGCCGAIITSVPLLATYIALIIIAMCVEIAIAIYVGVKRNEVGAQIANSMLDVVNNLYAQSNTSRLTVDSIQSDNMCCGVYNASDWLNSTYITSTSSNPGSVMKAPTSCCMNQTNSNSVSSCHVAKSYYPTGCLGKAQDWLQMFYPILIGIAAGIAGLEVLVVLFACCLCCGLRHRGEKTMV